MGHSCRKYPYDEPETPEPTDAFIDEWIAENRDTVIEDCIEKIEAAWLVVLEGQKEEAAIDRADVYWQHLKDGEYDN